MGENDNVVVIGDDAPMQNAHTTEANVGAANKVSIGLPVYNSEITVKATIDSLLAQTYPNIEVCISDNAINRWLP